MAVIDDNWNYSVDIKHCNLLQSESLITNLQNDLVDLHSFKPQNYKDNNGHCHDEELKELVEKNKQLRLEIDSKLEELSRHKTQYEDYKKDQKLLSQEIKDTHEAFLMAKKFYKKFLKIYYTVESRSASKQTLYLQFFTEARKESEEYSLRLNRFFATDAKKEYCELVDTKPALKNIEQIKCFLQENNDLPSTLCMIRQEFLKLKKK